MTAEGLWENPATIPKGLMKDPGSTAGGFRVVPRGMWGDFGSSMREPCQDMWSTVCRLRHCSRMTSTGRRNGSLFQAAQRGSWNFLLQASRRTLRELREDGGSNPGDSQTTRKGVRERCWRTPGGYLVTHCGTSAALAEESDGIPGRLPTKTCGRTAGVFRVNSGRRPVGLRDAGGSTAGGRREDTERTRCGTSVALRGDYGRTPGAPDADSGLPRGGLPEDSGSGPKRFFEDSFRTFRTP